MTTECLRIGLPTFLVFGIRPDNQGHFGAFESTGTFVAIKLKALRGHQQRELNMRKFTAITVLGVVLLSLLAASRLSMLTDSPVASGMDKGSSSVDGKRVAKERFQANETLPDRTSKAGGIWFW
jgi:hypothetical protein